MASWWFCGVGFSLPSAIFWSVSGRMEAVFSASFVLRVSKLSVGAISISGME